MSTRFSANKTSSGSNGSDYALPKLPSRRSREGSGKTTDRVFTSSSKASDSASSSGGTVWRGKSSRRVHLKLPSSFVKGSASTEVKKPEVNRPTLKRQQAFRAPEPKPSLKRQAAQFFGFALLDDIHKNLDAYKLRNEQLDTVPPTTPGRLRDRIEERSVYLGGTRELMKGRFVGPDANRIEDFNKQVKEEEANLSKVNSLLHMAETLDIAVKLPLQDLMRLVEWGIDKDSILLGVANGMDANTIIRLTRRYADLGIPFNERTLPNQLFCEANADVDAKRPLGSGAMNTVWLIPYTDPKTGKTYPMVFKPELDHPEMVNADAVFTGIGYKPTITKNGTLRFTEEGERKPANLAGRSVATYRVDQLLDLRIVPPTYLTVEGGQVGTVMALAPGYAPAMSDKTARVQLDSELAQWLREQPSDVLLEYAAAQGYSGLSLGGDDVLVLRREGGTDFEREILGVLNFNDPELRDQAIKLQFLDALCGQVDRNSKNLFVDGRALSAIDNDLAFGQMAEIGRDKCPALPTVVSAELRTKLLALTDEDLRATLSPLLEKAEVDAAVERLHVIQEALKATGDKAILVVSSAEEWQSEEVTRRLGIVSVSDRGLTNNEISDASEKSYLGRESAMQAVKSAENDKQSVPRYRIPLFSPNIVRNDLNQLRAQISAGA